MGKEKGITLVALVISIIILIILAGISINTLVGENGIITKAKEAKQNIILVGEAEALGLNQLYYELEKGGELTEDEESTKKDEIITSLQEELENLKSLLEQTDVTEDKILKDYKAYSKGKLLTGTMEDNGELNSNLNCGESYIIPVGYTSGGTIKANSLASQTPANATANNLSKGVTAWVNGVKITGNGMNINVDVVVLIDQFSGGVSSGVKSLSYTSDGTYNFFICDAGQSGETTTNGEILFQSGLYSIGGAHTHQLSIVKLTSGQYVTVSGWCAALYGIR